MRLITIGLIALLLLGGFATVDTATSAPVLTVAEGPDSSNGGPGGCCP
jgi:hypothetical protein